MKRFLFPAVNLLVLTVLAVSGCQSPADDPTPFAPQAALPAATKTGANTMGCTVNGELWLPAFTAAPGQGVTSRAGNGQLLLLGYQTSPAGETTSIRVEMSYGFHGVGTYPLFFPDWTDNQVAFTKEAQRKAYFADSLGSSELIITRYDSAQGILAGRFHFRGVCRSAAAPADTITISDGRFDLKLR